ncbi:MAG TPA: TonB-dependent receptor [Cyclobacteriaceae bacterium]|nr:TonB-dependent receptor [Cyclobacteriaceae bacterium]HMV10525.1 TonB-dependent receptor [Cyclobacteriaceae bacterium]HMV89621.1 TonB-dependent receptor [Cyclobacteriaceae bacterium]HMW99463.1 TonB-dependent receptor [Cyclobacteriaceae bacterium]HMX48748.1 TonB-dependent receptor [Cyclobacteriaceae bacterium]
MNKTLLTILLALTAVSALAQQTVSGVVKDSQGAPIEQVNVVITGTKAYAVTDSQGAFTLTFSAPLPVVVRVSSVGYKTQEVQLDSPDRQLEITLAEDVLLSEVVITARRRKEVAQKVPIAISVLSGETVEHSGAFNVNRLKELIPSVQLYSSNPRNTGINIRGLGSPFGLTNDGLDPGVGFYVDGVYYARPAAATFDFIDVERIEVLRGPQGTLFGKNTTSGAFNITTRKPAFTPGADVEVSYGNYGFVQAKTSVTGPLSKKLAARLSFSGTQRDGTIENIRTGKYINDINNLGLRAQLLFEPTSTTSVTLSADASRQRPDGYAQVVAGVVKTKRADYRQFDAIIADLNYSLPSRNAFDRKIDHDTPWKSNNDLGGVSLTVDSELGPGTLTSTTAWRYWDWDPSNDRDFTGLQALSKSQNPAEHRNWSQEIRYAGDISSRVSGVVGVFFIDQEVKINGTEESGSAQWRFSQSSTNALWQTPGLFEGFGIRTKASIKSKSAAVFANVDWEVLEGLHVMPGLRFNYDEKNVSYNRTAYGGLDTATYSGTKAQKTTLQGFKNGVYTSQQYVADANENNFTYNVTLAYKPTSRINAYVTYSTSYKPVGVNVAGLPTIDGQPATDLAVIKPEDVKHVEVGIKTTPVANATLNLTVYNTGINNYQTNVQSPELGVNRGYIANAEEVRVRGVELDGSITISKSVKLYGAAAYTDGEYVKFTNAPLPLEETGTTVDGVQVAFKDISGETLPGISKWSGSLGGEFTAPVNFLRQGGRFFFAVETFYRSTFSSSPSPSKYLNVDGYSLVNIRTGFRVSGGVSATLWARNVLNKDYFEQLLPAGGNAGHYAGVLGDPRTYGVTLHYSF